MTTAVPATNRKMRLTAELVQKVKPYTGEYRPQANGNQTPDEVREAVTDAVLRKLPPSGELWVFAVGSLIWKPGPEFGERRPGIIRGWHRAFCIGWDRAFRGNPDKPGLMLSLDRGGQCRGVALRIKGEGTELRNNLFAIVKREPPPPPTWVSVNGPDGPFPAIAFTIDRKWAAYVGGLTPDQIADAIAVSTGKLGSMAEYLFNTVTHLEQLGIHDRYLWQMQDLVAARLEALEG